MLEVTPVPVRCKLSITRIRNAAIPILLRVLGSLFLTKRKSISSCSKFEDLNDCFQSIR